jgi:hypothetical protein
MQTSSLQRFLEALCEVESAEGGAPLLLKVRYRQDSFEYDGSAPWSLDKITHEGVIDPGLGSGPVRYSEIETISVLPMLRGGHAVPLAELKFETLLKLVKSISEVEVLEDKIIFQHDQLKSR